MRAGIPRQKIAMPGLRAAHEVADARRDAVSYPALSMKMGKFQHSDIGIRRVMPARFSASWSGKRSRCFEVLNRRQASIPISSQPSRLTRSTPVLKYRCCSSGGIPSDEKYAVISRPCRSVPGRRRSWVAGGQKLAPWHGIIQQRVERPVICVSPSIYRNCV